MSAATDWVNHWGEIVNKTTAAKMLGISRRQVLRLIERGDLQTATDGRVLVRPAAEYFTGGKKAEPKPRKKAEKPVRETQKDRKAPLRFVM